MSRHRHVRNMNIQDELGGDALSDSGGFDITSQQQDAHNSTESECSDSLQLSIRDELEDGASDGEDHAMTPQQEEQMERGLEEVRNIIGDERISGLSDSTLRDVLWEYYFNIGRTVQWAIDEQARRQAAQARTGDFPDNKSLPPLPQANAASLVYTQPWLQLFDSYRPHVPLAYRPWEEQRVLEQQTLAEEEAQEEGAEFLHVRHRLSTISEERTFQLSADCDTTMTSYGQVIDHPNTSSQADSIQHSDERPASSLHRLSQHEPPSDGSTTSSLAPTRLHKSLSEAIPSLGSMPETPDLNSKADPLLQSQATPGMESKESELPSLASSRASSVVSSVASQSGSLMSTGTSVKTYPGLRPTVQSLTLPGTIGSSFTEDDDSIPVSLPAPSHMGRAIRVALKQEVPDKDSNQKPTPTSPSRSLHPQLSKAPTSASLSLLLQPKQECPLLPRQSPSPQSPSQLPPQRQEGEVQQEGEADFSQPLVVRHQLSTEERTFQLNTSSTAMAVSYGKVIDHASSQTGSIQRIDERPHYQDHLSKVYNLPSKGVLDLTGYIDCGEFIAAGGSGHIFRGKWKKPNDSGSLSLEQLGLPSVAVKLISIPALTDAEKKEKRFKRMKREIELWRQINHRNILPLVGIARIDGDNNRPALISPWMEYGNVTDFLKQNPSFPSVSFLHDIIEGLHFLHMFKPEIIHGDIKAVNVLVNHRKEAYLCDFGLSRFVVDNTLWRTTATQAGGTLRWMAPELIKGEASTSTKASDIYAYAMTCYEILSGKVPFDTVRTDANVIMKVVGGKRPERIASRHPDGLWSIITQCWAQNAEERLSTAEALRSVVQFIEGSDRLKEQMINIGKNIKAINPGPEKPPSEVPKRSPSPVSLSPAPPTLSRSMSNRPLHLTPVGAAPGIGRLDANTAVSVTETPGPYIILSGSAGGAEVKLVPTLVPRVMAQNAQRQTRKPSEPNVNSQSPTATKPSFSSESSFATPFYRKNPKRRLISTPLPIPTMSKLPPSFLPPSKIIQAIETYRSQAPHELSFQKGDFFYVLTDEGEQWYEAHNPVISARGFVPRHLFEELNRTANPYSLGTLMAVTTPPPPKSTSSASRNPPATLPREKPREYYAVVQHDFVAEGPHELDAKRGEAITVVAQSNREWFVAKPIGKVRQSGLIPVSFVRLHDPVTGQPIANVGELIDSGVLPEVEEWMRAMMAE